MKKSPHNLLVVTGPTATGKTAFAAQLAHRLSGEVISADSRQVYRGMDLATGKDISDYVVEGQTIPHHLVDILDPGYEYNVYEFQRDFLRVFHEITGRGNLPVLCGGTGLYIESVLRGYRLVEVPENPELRERLSKMDMDSLVRELKGFKVPHNITDIADRKRLIRALEIQVFEKKNPRAERSFPEIRPVVFALQFDRETIRQRITTRLQLRLEKGMVDEVRELLDKGLSPSQLKFYGLEYRYLTQFATGELTYDEMFNLLNTAIHQFAKRQMTWFRKMERQGMHIHWIEGQSSMQEKVQQALAVWQNTEI